MNDAVLADGISYASFLKKRDIDSWLWVGSQLSSLPSMSYQPLPWWPH